MIYIYMQLWKMFTPQKNNKCRPKADSQIFFHSYVSLSKGRDSVRVYSILCS